MNKDGLGKELLKQDGIDPERTSEAERTAFIGMLKQEKARTHRRRWITSICLLVVDNTLPHRVGYTCRSCPFLLCHEMANSAC